MTNEQLRLQQKEQRNKALEAILNSKSKKKIIVAGPGTGKTFTFGELLKRRSGENNLAMTFIRKLVADMEAKLGAHSEVKTFHAYCKKILHDQNGKVEIAPFLTKIVEKDALLLENGLTDFDEKFQTLDEASPALSFHLKRGDYYEVVGFDDSVYRLYKLLQKQPKMIASFGQIVIDEFQDFHKLEVAFINELSKKGDILIVGDDDQAVYGQRNASPTYLRDIHKSPEFEKFELPFCGRCPEAIVTATNSIIQQAEKTGHFRGRVQRKYECYIEAKEVDSLKYPKIIVAECTTGLIVPRYIKSEILKISPEDIVESRKEGEEYPTVLIIGPKHYLEQIEKQLKPVYPQLIYAPSTENDLGIIDAYIFLLRDNTSNFGWRILTDIFVNEQEQKCVIQLSQKNIRMIDLLDKKFVDSHIKALGLVKRIREGEPITLATKAKLTEVLGELSEEVILYFSSKEDKETETVDKTKPSILLTSYVGCKGLSAGHVFIVGAHNGSMPKNPNHIKDIEISQFIVALTRTRKQCHVIYNDWVASPKDNGGRWTIRFEKSKFISWIPDKLIKNIGRLSRGNF